MAPAVVIRLGLEAAPVVYVDALDDGEEKRLADWLTEARPEYGDLVLRAMELVELRRLGDDHEENRQRPAPRR